MASSCTLRYINSGLDFCTRSTLDPIVSEWASSLHVLTKPQYSFEPIIGHAHAIGTNIPRTMVLVTSDSGINANHLVLGALYRGVV